MICPGNTLHQALDLVRGQSPARWLHIAEEVAAAAATRRFQRVGILGTRYLMEGTWRWVECSLGREFHFFALSPAHRR